MLKYIISKYSIIYYIRINNNISTKFIELFYIIFYKIATLCDLILKLNI